MGVAEDPHGADEPVQALQRQGRSEQDVGFLREQAGGPEHFRADLSKRQTFSFQDKNEKSKRKE